MNTFLQETKVKLTVWILWSLLMLPMMIYLIVLFTSHMRAPVEWSPADMPRWLGSVPVIVIVFSLGVRRAFLDGFKTGRQHLGSVEGCRRFLVGHVICFALAESACLPGLILRFEGYPAEFCERFLMGGLGILAWHIPLARRFQPES